MCLCYSFPNDSLVWDELHDKQQWQWQTKTILMKQGFDELLITRVVQINDSSCDNTAIVKKI